MQHVNWSGLFGVLAAATVFTGGVWAIVRGIIRQTDATKDNTDAIKSLTDEMKDVSKQVADNSQRIARLEGRRR